MRERFIAAVAAGVMGATGCVAQVTFQGVQGPSGYDINLFPAVSGDGSTVVGTLKMLGQDSTTRAFRWTKTSGFEILQPMPGFDMSRGRAVSGDGSLVVGSSATPGIPPRGSATGWDRSGSAFEIGPALPSGSPTVYGVSDDGRNVIANGAQGPFRWTATGGFQPLSPGSDFVGTSAQAISHTGVFVVGIGRNPTTNTSQAAIWEGDGPATPLPFMTGATVFNPTAVSDDGRTVVGTSGAGTHAYATRWRAGEGTVPLEELTNSEYVYAYGLSADGTVAVGSCQQIDIGMSAVIWDNNGHIRRLVDVLVEAGIDMTGWEFLPEVTSVSADGRTLVGTYANPDSSGVVREQLWIATIPTPGTLFVLVAGVPNLFRPRRGGPG